MPSSVAPLAGAWIETKVARKIERLRRSRPTRARGLKHGEGKSLPYKITTVAPLAGAWIETGCATKCGSKCPASRPSRARGLKHVGDHAMKYFQGRAPRGRVD